MLVAGIVVTGGNVTGGEGRGLTLGYKVLWVWNALLSVGLASENIRGDCTLLGWAPTWMLSEEKHKERFIQESFQYKERDSGWDERFTLWASSVSRR